MRIALAMFLTTILCVFLLSKTKVETLASVYARLCVHVHCSENSCVRPHPSKKKNCLKLFLFYRIFVLRKVLRKNAYPFLSFFLSFYPSPFLCCIYCTHEYCPSKQTADKQATVFDSIWKVGHICTCLASR